MAGLKSLGFGGSFALGKSLGNSSTATIAQTAYGQQNSPNTDTMSGVQSWHLATAVPVVALVWLAFLRWSLPR